MKIWEPEPPRTLWATPGLLRDSFTFTFYSFLLETELTPGPYYSRKNYVSACHEGT